MLIYEAYNKNNGKSYIGLTTHTLEKRKSQHLRSAKSGSLLHFHKALRKHGANAFEWSVILSCKELDKDLRGDKTSYSPETCTFVSKKINMFLQLKTPEFYRGYWQATARLPDKTRHKFKGKSRTRVFEAYINSKRLALSMLSDEDCPPNIRVLVEHKLKTFREENL